ncbi:MAG: 50S ribosomal protein L3 [Alphaproteobacteria bacterium]
MALNLLGRKLGMLQFFDEQGLAVGVTLVEAGPCVVTQVKTVETDGYEAVQLGFLDKKERVTTKPMRGHFAKAGTGPKRVVRESRVEDASAYSVGQELTVGELYKPGDFVDVQGVSKGRGFAGSIKRHGMARAPETHGAPAQRMRGSTGQSATPARTHKGVRLPGHMGNCSMTVQSLRIVAVRPEDNQILIEGAVPGPTMGIVAMRKALKKRSLNAT